nr:hypothetical protein [Tanacetum cinerariifolium]
VLRVEGLESANTAQQLTILKLKARMKKLERLNKVKSSKLRRLKKVGTSQRIDSSEDEENVKGRQADTQAEIYNIDLDHTFKVLSMQEDTEVQEVVEVVNAAKFTTEVVTAAATQVVAVSTPISAAKPAAKPKVLKIVPAAPTVSTRKRKGVAIRDPEEELHDDTPAETFLLKIKAKYIRRCHVYKKKPQSESEARKNMIAYLKNTKGFKMAFLKGKTYDQIRPIFQARFDANMRFLLKSKEEMEKEEEEIIKSINETPAQKATKRRRLLEQAKEDENLKKQFENFDKEDLEDLWKIVKARFSTSKPTNFTDDNLLVTLKNMFEKADAQDVIWRSQQTEHGQQYN